MIKITVKDVEDNIQDKVFFSGADGYNGQHFRTTIGFPNTPKRLELVTFCVLVLRSGFIVTGQSMCANAENYDWEIGRDTAYENAIGKVVDVMLYAAMAQPKDTRAVAQKSLAKHWSKLKRSDAKKAVPKVIDPEAPWGRKKDGTPAKRRGRLSEAENTAIAASEAPLI
jgi:hypothetical protein